MFCVTISLKPVASVHHGLVVFYKCAPSWIHAMKLVTDHISKISTAIGRVRPFLRTFVRFYCSWPLTTDPDIFSCEQVINDHSSPEIKVKVKVNVKDQSKNVCATQMSTLRRSMIIDWLMAVVVGIDCDDISCKLAARWTALRQRRSRARGRFDLDPPLRAAV